MAERDVVDTLCVTQRAPFSTPKVCGHYGTKHEVVLRGGDANSYVMYQSDAVRSQDPAKRLLVSDTYGDDEGKVDSSDREAIEKVLWRKCYIFYSTEEFSRLIGYIEPLPPTRSDNPHRYTQMMTPVPKWCEMARSALPPVGEAIYMSERAVAVEGTTTALLISQQKLLEQYTDLLMTIIPSWLLLPELVKLLAPYAVLYAAGVRVVWSDDEEQSEALRAGKEYVWY